MHLTVSLLWIAGYASIAWGVLRFFRRPSTMTLRTGVVAALGLAIGVGHGVAVLGSQAPAPLQVSGGALVAGGLLLFWSAVRACADRRLTAIFEPDAPTFLVRSGPYAWVRHPFYASYSLFWLGGALASRSVLAGLSAVLMLGVYLSATKDEEAKFAASTLAADYADYRACTGRVVPRVRAMVAVLTGR